MAVLSHRGPPAAAPRAVAALLGSVCRALSLAMLVPAAVGLVLGEHRSASALVIGAALAWLVGRWPGPLDTRLTWSQAFTGAGLAWLVAALVAAVPLALSGHHGSLLQTVVEAMAGLTTTGTTFVEDLDHLDVSMNLWRHALHPLGAVAVLLVVATIRQRGDTFVATSTVAEAGEHRILPRTSRSVRAAAGLVVVWSALGTLVLVPLAMLAGATPGRAVLHAVTLATSAFSTGGFTVTSASAGALHAASVQLVLVVLMIAGATSLVLHRSLWARRARLVTHELDVRVGAASLAVLTAVVLLGLARAGAHTEFEGLLRHGVFTTIAAHTTTGMSVGSGRLIATGWGELAPAALVGAMAVGGMAGSAAGGIGTLRVGIILKGVIRDVRALLLPESAVVVATYHQGRRHRLTDQHVRAAATVFLLVLGGVFAGAVVELATTDQGDLPEALFAATSAISTTGLSVGFVGPSLDWPPLLTTGLLMWFGRLEFLAVLASLGLLVRHVPGVGGRG